MRHLHSFYFLSLLAVLLMLMSCAQNSHQAAGQLQANQVRTAQGILEGASAESGVRIFKGVPFAAPPLGEFRWKEPQPPAHWEGVRKADAFGPRAMQLPLFGDMDFRAKDMSEDCLYLNVWTPAGSEQERLPVLVYFYGGGFVAGDGSEPRYDGESMAQKGIVAVTVNYRLGVFGFMAHPELTQESGHHASGNYGLMDQSAALRWVQQNIEAFGGDPARITIAGESAGSYSVSAQMASPHARDLIAGAIGESGSLLSLRPTPRLEQGEQQGLHFAEQLRASSLAELRAIPAQQLLEETGKSDISRFWPVVDGYFFPRSPLAIFEAGEQAQVPLLAGWNSEEMNYGFLFGDQEPTPQNYIKVLEKQFGEHADEVLKLYPATTREEVVQAATELAGDLFIGFSTWKWLELHAKNSNAPVYRYMYARPRPEMRPEMGDATAGLAGGVQKDADPDAKKAPKARGAVHSAEIEYAMGNLDRNKVFAWTADDYKVSEIMQGYFANFIKSANPNGPGLVRWPAMEQDKPVQVMHIDVHTRVEEEQDRERYLFLDKIDFKP